MSAYRRAKAYLASLRRRGLGTCRHCENYDTFNDRDGLGKCWKDLELMGSTMDYTPWRHRNGTCPHWHGKSLDVREDPLRLRDR